MAATLGNGSVTFGDGTVQTTKTPIVTSAFTNDSNYVTTSYVAANYTTKTNAAYSFQGHGDKDFGINWYDVTGTLMGSTYFNCNCNC